MGDRELQVLLTGGTYFEGPRWRDGEWWVSDFHRHQVSRVSPSGAETVVLALQHRPSGLGWLPDGSLVVASMEDRRVLRLAGGEVGVLADLAPYTGSHVNDLVVDAAGHVFVGEFGSDVERGEAPRTATVLRVDPDGTVAVAAEDLWFPNGMVITPDGGTLVVGETFGNRFTAFDLAPDGTLSHRRVWAQLGPEPTAPLDLGSLRCGPDGSTLDAAGCIWTGDAIGGDALRVAAGEGVVDRITPPPGLRAYACALGGDDGRTLLLCCAPDGDAASRTAARGAVLLTTTVEVPHAGRP